MKTPARSLLLSWALLSCAGAHRSDTTCPPVVPPPMAVLAPVVPSDGGLVLPAIPPLVRHRRHRSCVVHEIDGSVVDEVEEDLEPADINPLLDRATQVVTRVLEPMDASVVQRRMLQPLPDTDASVEPPVDVQAAADAGTPVVDAGGRHHGHHRRR